MKIKYILIALALLFSTRLSAQETADYGDELEELWQTDQININDLSPEVAFNILHLTDYQYYQLLSYIELYGELVSEYELAAIAGFDQNLADGRPLSLGSRSTPCCCDTDKYLSISRVTIERTAVGIWGIPCGSVGNTR